jgi:putative glutamine amidotransferase
MKQRPLILVTSATLPRGVELGDPALCVSRAYLEAVAEAGGVPVVTACQPEPRYVRDAVARCDGVLLTGGEDLQPELHAPGLPPALRATIKQVEPDRDAFELALVREVFRRRKPLFAICRGHQLVNVALGGTLWVDLPAQWPGALRHQRPDRLHNAVHEIELAPGSRLARLLRAGRAGVNSTHHQAVARPAEVLAVAGLSPDGVIEALELAPSHAGALPWFLAVQFHPERLVQSDPRFRALFRDFVRACAGQAGDGGANRRPRQPASRGNSVTRSLAQP